MRLAIAAMLLLAALFALAFGLYAAGHAGVLAAALKIGGRGSACSWSTISRFGDYAQSVTDQAAVLEKELRQIDEYSALGIAYYTTPTGRSYWIRKDGKQPGRNLLANLIVDHQEISRQYPQIHVQPGEVVLDVGAHVGTFTAVALSRGASKVYAVEPDPTNLECLRRNFRTEIEAGAVVVIPEAAWDQKSTLTLHESDYNSGMPSLVYQHRQRSIDVLASPIDDMVARYGISRIDFVKMDIEGAERNALRGGTASLKRFRPRLMLDAYHLADDAVVLPAILSEAAAYRQISGPCEVLGGRVVPALLFFQAGR